MKARQAVAVADVGEWTPPVGRRWEERDARSMARAYAQAGESVSAFARRHGLNEQRVRWWLGRLAELDGRRPAVVSAATAPFALVRVVGRRKLASPVMPGAARAAAPGAPPAGGGDDGNAGRIEVVIGGHVVRVGQGFCAETLRRIVSALAGGAC